MSMLYIPMENPYCSCKLTIVGSKVLYVGDHLASDLLVPATRCGAPISCVTEKLTPMSSSSSSLSLASSSSLSSASSFFLQLTIDGVMHLRRPTGIPRRAATYSVNAVVRFGF